MFETLEDARTALINSGVLEVIEFDMVDDVAAAMYENDKSAEDVVNILADGGLL